ncbi:MAG TPA: quinone oxidoreductase [Longimicrobiaceae bacterium]|nr:quinone oxidoreductase [Longimicrobiaceae bacterium]
MKGIRVSEPGGIEALEYTEIETPEPGPGEALVRLEAIGVNFIDIYHRMGLYPLPTPFTPGSEGAGVVEAVGSGVSQVRTGDRVAFYSIGAYAEYATVPADKLIPLPDGIEARTAAAAVLQGFTAHYLAVSTHSLKAGEKILVHAAAGGVGGLLVQFAKQRGAFVYGTASTSKLDVAREAGVDVVIDYTRDDFEQRIMGDTGGEGLDVVYDSVAKDTFDRSLNCVKLRGLLVMYGNSSGPVPPFDVLRLAKKGVYLTRPSLGHYTATRDELLWRARELLEAIQSGAVRLRIDRELPLREAGQAQDLLEGRKTAGKVILIP